MAVNWMAYNLTGSKDGSNKTFGLAVIPDPRATRIYFNGDILYRVPNDPAPTEYSISGNTILLGHAPSANDDIWAYVAEAVAVITASTVEVRPDFYFHVELRDTAGRLKEVFQRDIESIWWEYFTSGGCGACEIGLSREFDNYGDIAIDYEVQIWRQLNPLGEPGTPLPAELPILLGTTLSGSRQLRYSGIVRALEPVFDEEESVRLHCYGFSWQLSRIFIPRQSYTGQDIGAAVRELTTDFLEPGTKIQRTPELGLVPDIGKMITDAPFDAYAAEVIENLAELGGNLEAGVRADKEIYFVPRTDIVRQTYYIAKDVARFRAIQRGDDVVNRVYLRGADLEMTFGSFQSNNQKEEMITAPFITNPEDATLFLIAYFAKWGAPQWTGSLALDPSDKWIENPGTGAGADHPLGLLRVAGAPQFLERGEPLPDQLPMTLGTVMGVFTDRRFRINSIKYTPNENALDIEIDLGEQSNRLADRLAMIERRLSEIRQLAV